MVGGRLARGDVSFWVGVSRWEGWIVTQNWSRCADQTDEYESVSHEQLGSLVVSLPRASGPGEPCGLGNIDLFIPCDKIDDASAILV